MNQRWRHWRDTLPNLENVSIPQCYHRRGFGTVERREIHAFSDASKEAIGIAVYLREVDTGGESTQQVYLDLNCAVLATQAVGMIRKELDVKVNEETYHGSQPVEVHRHCNQPG